MVKYDWEKMEEIKMSGTHQGRLKTLGECQAGTGTKDGEFPENIGYSSKREKDTGKEKMRKGIKNREK